MLPDLVVSLLYWAAASSLAIALIDTSPLAALALAVAGGILGGLMGHEIRERRLAAAALVDGSSSSSVRSFHWPVAVLIGLNYGWFVFTDHLSLAGLLPLAALYLVRIVRMRLRLSWTPHDFSIFLLVLLTLVSGLVLTVDGSLSMPKLYGLALSVLMYYEVAYGVRRKENLDRWLVALSAAGLGMAGLGLLGTGWFSAKFLNLAKIYAFIPRIITDIPRSIRDGFHPNGVGGTLIFVIPVYAVQLIAALQGDRSVRSHRRGLIFGPNLAALTSTTITLVLTQSRGALLALAIAAVVLFLAWHQRWVLSLTALFSLLILVAVLLARFPELLGVTDVAQAETKALSSYQFRLAVWRMALEVLTIFPLSGAGIGTFDTVARSLFPYLYPQSLLYDPSATITHTHNELLQVAIDLGIPGLVAYVALLTAFVRTAWRAYVWAPSERTRRVVLGLGAGMLAHQLFGLTDAFLLGTKPGIVMWILMGLTTGLYLRLAPDHLRPSSVS
jgi:putative inorganic carbon (HCO3(-)) transporter